MSKKKIKAFHYTSMVLDILERVLNPKFNVDGLSNIPDGPCLFVANHFTRFETFIIPYIIYKKTNRQVRCLGDSGLFKGGLGRYLKKVGAISTKDPKRNDIIISDLMSGDYDWMIYPEGAMIKSKEIYFKGGFFSNTPSGLNRTRTGATVLALKSELYRQDLIKAHKKNDIESINFYKKNYNIEYTEKLKSVDTYIVPINITYYPIRPGENIIKRTTQRLLKNIPKSTAEELEIEGNLLLSANINVSFGKAIRVADYSRKSCQIIRQIPIMKSETKVNMVINYLKYNLTGKFMKDIYFNTKINIDHLFTYVLFFYKEDKIKIEHLKNIIYASAVDIAHTKKYRLSYSIEEKNLFKIFSSEWHKEFESIVKLAECLNIIKESKDGEYFIINKKEIDKKSDFSNIRKENTLQVIFNEFSLLNTAKIAVKKSMSRSEERLRKEVFKKIFKQDKQNFKNDYKKYYDSNFPKDKSIGKPFFLDGDIETYKKIGIILCHGYQSAPEEMRQMAIYLNNLGFSVYVVRLKGHGTSPQNIQYINNDDWYDSLQRGYCAMNRICSKIILIGFSTGGLLSLLACSKKPNDKIIAVIVINAALKLQDIRARLIVPGITIWNDLLSKFKIQKAKLEYIENNSENPSVNYSRNYLSGVNELGKLMNKCHDSLHDIKNPALIIYSKNDPVVDPSGSIVINNIIKSDIKKLVGFDMDNHIIVCGENNIKIFDVIKKFILSIL
jgi:esterase/lipase